MAAIETINIDVVEDDSGIVSTVTPSPVTEVLVDVVSDNVSTAITQQNVSINYDVAYGLSGGGGIGTMALQEHINSQAPHPAYDTGIVRLDILFENGLI